MRKFLASARLCDDVPRKLLRSNLNLFLTGRHRRRHQQQFSTSTQDLLQNATKNVSNILANSMKLQQSEKLMVLYDNQCELSSLLCQAYKDAAYPCGDQIFADFDTVTPDFILDHIDNNLNEGDLAVLIQTGAFNLREYRFRLELFKRGIKNVEHVHLGLLSPEQYSAYIDALGFNPQDEAHLAQAIKNKMDTTKRTVVTCKGGAQLVYDTEMEPALLNIGNYEGMKNVGGTFPVGEVFTEPQSLEAINGEVSVWAFPNLSRTLEVLPRPITLPVRNGIIPELPSSFDAQYQQLGSLHEVIEMVRAGEGEVAVREFGLGLNRAMSKLKPVNDVTQLGMHISIGKKHTVYKKPGIATKRTRFHIDLFVDVDTIEMDGTIIFKDGDFNVCCPQ